jgi:hypothetical protein
VDLWDAPCQVLGITLPDGWRGTTASVVVMPVMTPLPSYLLSSQLPGVFSIPGPTDVALQSTFNCTLSHSILWNLMLGRFPVLDLQFMWAP